MTGAAPPLVARVLPDVSAIDRVFDYLVPDALAPDVRVGTRVRVPLHGRRVGGWVLDVSRGAPPGERRLLPLAKVTGWGPSPDLVALSEWAARRWAGPRASFLRTASPPGAVRSLPAIPPAADRDQRPVEAPVALTRALDHGTAVVRLPPGHEVGPLVAAAAALGDALVLVPSLARAAALARWLGQRTSVALLPDGWARAAAGGSTVVGARAGAWAPAPRLAVVVVLDEHDEAYQQERAPTWHARDVAVERARRAGVPCVLVSPCPSLEALEAAELVTLERSVERAGWPVLEVVDRRAEAPGLGLYSERLVAVLRGGGRVVCVLNRKGRARLLACNACGELARCETCDAAVHEVESGGGDLGCTRCAATRPRLCSACGSQRLRVLRVGVSRAREDLERLVGEPVDEVTAASEGMPATRVVVGTEAALHRVRSADVVAFLEFDQELLAPRFRAGEQALALLARAARLLGGRAAGGRLLVQTRVPGHEVLDAVVHADPSRVAVVESARRVALRLPPESALAVVSGPAAEPYADALRHAVGVELLGPADGRWLVRAPDHETLVEALASTPRPPGRLRVEVDPLRA